MIDFRYHLVSIIAIFLALGLGIVVGTTALNGAVVDDLNRRVSGLKTDKDALREQVLSLQDDADSANAFARAVGPALVAGRLRGRDVGLIAAPGAARDARDALATMIERAGGRIVARVRMTDEFYDEKSASEIDDVVARVVPPGLQLPRGSAAERATTALAFVLSTPLRRPAAGARPERPPPATTTSVIDAFQEANLVGVDGAAPRPAPLVVVLLPPVPKSPGSATADDLAGPLVALVRQLAQRAPAVVVAASRTGATTNPMLLLLRRDSVVSGAASTVDGAESPQGQVATVLALVDEVAGRRGDYGEGAGVDGALPSLEPSPAA
ncbi:MAG: copper transporter [Frankia sp.]|nr:copper transporter [Frankia sp.]